MFLSIDLGGSTVDIVEFFDDSKNSLGVSSKPPLSPPFPQSRLCSGQVSGGTYRVRASLESAEVDKNNLEEIFKKAKVDYSVAEKIVFTGGHSRKFSGDFFGIPLETVSEIDAIGTGGTFLRGEDSGLVCSLGTGTCFVSVKKNICEHVGGTGVGGGTFLGLGKVLFGENTFSEISALVAKGESANVDLLVKDIVGEGIGMIPETATASNLAKLSPDSSKQDMARGIVNMVGQTIASLAVFTARTYTHKNIILGGKLIRLPQIQEIAEKTAEIYGQNIIVSKNAEYISAIGAGIFSCKGKKTLVPHHCEP